MGKRNPIGVVHDIIQEGNPRQIADACRISVSLLYKMGEPGEQHRTNFLESFIRFYHATGDLRLIHAVCAEARGVFVPDPPAAEPRPGADLLTLFGQFHIAQAELGNAIGKIEKHHGTTPADIRRLRKRWERFKARTEGLVRAAERGRFAKKIIAWTLPLWPVADALTPGGFF